VYTVKKMGDLDFLGMMLPEDYCGVPANLVELAIMAEEIAKESVALAHFIILTYVEDFLLVSLPNPYFHPSFSDLSLSLERFSRCQIECRR
jgi:alkylation response protein AidB-like acyl-CoA dehydrogenase